MYLILNMIHTDVSKFIKVIIFILHVHFAIMHVLNNRLFSKLLLVIANLCNLQFFFGKFICVHGFDRSTDTIVLY